MADIPPATPTHQPRYLLVADDDEDDHRLIGDAIRETHGDVSLTFVRDGRELLDYLRREGRYADCDAVHQPDIVLLDLNMPGMGGREALKEIREDERLRALPVMVMSTSAAPEDVGACYRLGANAYITKPEGFEALVVAMRRIREFWLELAALPRTGA